MAVTRNGYSEGVSNYHTVPCVHVIIQCYFVSKLKSTWVFNQHYMSIYTSWTLLFTWWFIPGVASYPDRVGEQKHDLGMRLYKEPYSFTGNSFAKIAIVATTSLYTSKVAVFVVKTSHMWKSSMKFVHDKCRAFLSPNGNYFQLLVCSIY